MEHSFHPRCTQTPPLPWPPRLHRLGTSICCHLLAPQLNLWQGALSAGGTRLFLGDFLVSTSVLVGFFFLPFNPFPHLIRKSYDSSWFFCPEYITFINGPNQEWKHTFICDTSPDFKSLSIYCLYQSHCMEHRELSELSQL